MITPDAIAAETNTARLRNHLSEVQRALDRETGIDSSDSVGELR